MFVCMCIYVCVCVCVCARARGRVRVQHKYAVLKGAERALGAWKWKLWTVLSSHVGAGDQEG